MSDYGRFSIGNVVLSGGSNGMIVSGVDYCTGDDIVVKKFFPTTAGEIAFHREAQILALLRKKKYIVNVVGVSHSERAIGMKKYDCDLFTLAFSEGLLSPERVQILFRDICYAIQNLHRNGIAHLDIKPENILIDTKTMKPHICDFGSAFMQISCEEKNSIYFQGSVGTVEYMAPEVKQKSRWYNPFTADIFSLGCLLYVLSTGYFPKFDNRGRLLFATQVAGQCESLLRLMVLPDPTSRPTIDDIVKHPYIRASVFTKFTNMVRSL